MTIIDPTERAVFDRLAGLRDEIRHLEKHLRSLRRRRDLLIVKAVDFGMSYRTLEPAAGISNVAITQIMKAHRDADPGGEPRDDRATDAEVRA